MNYLKTEIVKNGGVELANHLPDIGIQKVKDEIISGLKSFPKFISPKFFYDEIGSELFEKITTLEEYYPTRTEKEILSEIGEELSLNFSNLNIIELGSGDNSKIRLLLRQIPKEELTTVKYCPVDISQSAIEKATGNLADEFSSITINGIIADFIHQINLVPKTNNRLFCFFGSTIGNLNKSERKEFLQRLGAEMQAGESLLLGMDMEKEIEILEKAYNDKLNITADFNKNILNVVNSLTESDFNPTDFEHLAFYNKEEKRIEMHLKANKEIDIAFKSNSEKIHIEKGETIHTENSHKFTVNDIQIMGKWAGLETEKIFFDACNWFSLVHFKKRMM